MNAVFQAFAMLGFVVGALALYFLVAFGPDWLYWRRESARRKAHNLCWNCATPITESRRCQYCGAPRSESPAPGEIQCYYCRACFVLGPQGCPDCGRHKAV